MELSAILDPVSMQHSFGDWSSACAGEIAAENLSEAEYQRLKSTGTKLGLVAEERVLVIGCLAGSLSHNLATVLDLNVTAITFGQKSTEATKLKCRNLPMVKVQ